MIHVPINAVSWTIGALSCSMFSLKSWRSYKLTRNPLARMYCILGVVFGTALFFFGTPGLFTQDPHILRYTYFFADLFVQITLQVALWMLWFLGLRGRVRLDYLYLVSIPFSAVLLTLQAMTSQVAVSTEPYLLMYTDKPPVLALKSIIYMAIALPIGYFLLRQVPKQVSLKSKIKSFMAGMTYIVICLAATTNNLFDQGSDTVGSATVVAIFFTVFFFAQLPRPSAERPAR